MDPKTTAPINNSEPQVTQPMTATADSIVASPTQSPDQPKKSNTLLFGLVALGVIVIGGILAFMVLGSGKKTEAPVVTQEYIPSPTIVPSEEQEVDGVAVDDPEKDFSDVDADLKSL